MLVNNQSNNGDIKLSIQLKHLAPEFVLYRLHSRNETDIT